MEKMKESKKVFIINAAGGNATALMVLNKPLKRKEYSEIGKKMMTDFSDYLVEQAGFLVLLNDHFEMSGGEFCGNAARAAALLFNYFKKVTSFTMSGFDGKIEIDISNKNSKKPVVSCYFPGLTTSYQNTDQGNIKIVDLGGIVHIVILGDFPKENYKKIHKKLTNEFSFTNRPAVGVIWLTKQKEKVRIDPVVWVKEIDSFFYESSCGSGSIAAAAISNCSKIIQPSLEEVTVELKDKGILLTSEMEVIYECRY